MVDFVVDVVVDVVVYVALIFNINFSFELASSAICSSSFVQGLPVGGISTQTHSQ